MVGRFRQYPYHPQRNPVCTFKNLTFSVFPNVKVTFNELGEVLSKGIERLS